MAETHEEWIKRLFKPSRFHDHTVQSHIDWLQKYGWDAISIHESVTGKWEEWPVEKRG